MVVVVVVVVVALVAVVALLCVACLHCPPCLLLLCFALVMALQESGGKSSLVAALLCFALLACLHLHCPPAWAAALGPWTPLGFASRTQQHVVALIELATPRQMRNHPESQSSTTLAQGVSSDWATPRSFHAWHRRPPCQTPSQHLQCCGRVGRRRCRRHRCRGCVGRRRRRRCRRRR